MRNRINLRAMLAGLHDVSYRSGDRGLRFARLREAGASWEARRSVLVDRFPLTYAPDSSARIIEERLPPIDERADMALAHRETSIIQQAHRAAYSAQDFAFLPVYLCLLLVIGFPITAMVDFQWALTTAAAVSTGWLIAMAIQRQLTLRRLLFLILLTVLVSVGGYTASALLSHRLVAGVLLGAVACAVVAVYGRRLVRFLQEWILAHPRLTPTTRAHMLAERLPAPSLAVAATLLAIAAIVPRFSTTLSWVLVVLISAAWCAYVSRGRVLALLRGAQNCLGLAISYGAGTLAAPGTWIPSTGLGRRSFSLGAMVAMFALTLAIGHKLYVPDDLLDEQAWRGLNAAGEHPWSRYVVERAFPGLDWSSLPAVTIPDPPTREPQSPADARADNPRAFPADGADRALAEHRRSAAEEQSVALASHRAAVRHVEQRRADYARWNFGDRTTTPAMLMLTAAVGGAYSLLWLVPLSLALAFFTTYIALLAVFARPIAAALALSERVEDNEGGPDSTPARSEWEWAVDRMRFSAHEAPDPLTGKPVRECEHLFLGVEPYRGFPVLLDRAALSEHVYITGESGSGKTALGISPLLMQLIRARRDPAQQDGQTRPPPLVILDLKGDPALFHTVRREAEQRRKELGIEDPADPRFAFKFFTPEPGRASHRFNPFASLRSSQRSTVQLCELILDSLALSHGEGYGRSYYTRRSRHTLLRALDDPSKPDSFEELYAVLTNLCHDAEHGVAFELLSAIEGIAQYPNIAAPDGAAPPEHAIHMPSVLEHSQTVYFWLPAALESISVREIGKLALYSLLTAAIDRQRDGGAHRQTYLVIDEFQRIAGENFRIVLEQARSFGVSAILANQTQADLRTPDADLRPTVRSNTRVKMFFAVTDPIEARLLTEQSGEELCYLRSWGAALFPTATEGVVWGVNRKTETEHLKPRVTLDDVMRTTDEPNEFFLHVSRGSGHTQFGGVPIAVRCPWPMTEADYRARAATPWPRLEELRSAEAVVPKEAPQDVDRRARERGMGFAQQAMQKLWEKYGPVTPFTAPETDEGSSEPALAEEPARGKKRKARPGAAAPVVVTRPIGERTPAAASDADGQENPS